jgi:hypothetical protein
VAALADLLRVIAGSGVEVDDAPVEAGEDVAPLA